MRLLLFALILMCQIQPCDGKNLDSPANDLDSSTTTSSGLVLVQDVNDSEVQRLCQGGLGCGQNKTNFTSSYNETARVETHIPLNHPVLDTIDYNDYVGGNDSFVPDMTDYYWNDDENEVTGTRVTYAIIGICGVIMLLLCAGIGIIAYKWSALKNSQNTERVRELEQQIHDIELLEFISIDLDAASSEGEVIP